MLKATDRIIASREVLVLVHSLGHPHLPCFPFFYGASGSRALPPLTPFFASLKLLHCRTSTSIYACHTVCCRVILSLHASSETGGGDDVELDGINDQSSVDVVQVVVVQQLGGHGGPQRGNFAA